MTNPLDVSPLGLVSKTDPGEFRLIHGLSYTKNNYVNSLIAPEFSPVSCEMLDDCIRIMLQLGQGCLVTKAYFQDKIGIIPSSHVDKGAPAWFQVQRPILF